jgi:hypothetical protein
MNLVVMLNTEERFQNKMEHFQSFESEMDSVHQREAVARDRLEKVVEMTPEQQMDLIQKSVEKEAKKYANPMA